MFKHCGKHVASKAWTDSSAERTFHCSRSGLMCWCSIRPWRQLTWFLHTKPNMREDHFPPKTHLLFSFSWHALSSQRPDTILIFKFAHHAYYLFYNLKNEMEKKYYHSYFLHRLLYKYANKTQNICFVTLFSHLYICYDCTLTLFCFIPGSQCAIWYSFAT